MRYSKFAETQIVSIFEEADAGRVVRLTFPCCYTRLNEVNSCTELTLNPVGAAGGVMSPLEYS